MTPERIAELNANFLDITEKDIAELLDAAEQLNGSKIVAEHYVAECKAAIKTMPGETLLASCIRVKSELLAAVEQLATIQHDASIELSVVEKQLAAAQEQLAEAQQNRRDAETRANIARWDMDTLRADSQRIAAAQLTAAQERIRELSDALRSLANEASGFISVARDAESYSFAHGRTNINVMQLRIDEASAALKEPNV